MKKLMFICLLVLIVSCSINKDQKASSPRKVKNLILMIGDGMGPGQISLLYFFSKYSGLNVPQAKPFAFDRMAKLGSTGISATEPEGNIVVDSACSATQLAIGKKSKSEMVGLDHNGDPSETILQKAQKKGLKTGLVSDTRLTHATPASFISHVSNRKKETQIAEQMVMNPADIMFSAGANFFRQPGNDLIEKAKENNIQFIQTKEELNQLDPERKVLGLFNSGDYPSALWLKHHSDSNRTIPTLKEMTQAAVKHLSNSPDGFFLMVEAGQIDWSGHQNDAGGMLHEMLSMNQTLNWLIDWVEKHPDTLLVVTADHETGGFGFNYNKYEVPAPVKLNGNKFQDEPFSPNFNYGRYEVLTKLYNQKVRFFDLWIEFNKLPVSEQTALELKRRVENATSLKFSLEDAERILGSQVKSSEKVALIGRALADQVSVSWGTTGHTATPVQVYAIGPKQITDQLEGFTHHAELGELMQQALGL